MSKQTTDIVAYITPIGLIIALIAGDRYISRFHLNQALVIWLAGVIFRAIGFIPLIGIVSIAGYVLCFVCWIMGLFGAINGTEHPIPILGRIRLL